ncbi:hypothetical protein [Micrococcus luteus]|nr:hypothetical protein [Micrococcus luteus]
MSTSVPSSHDGHVRPAATTTADRPTDAGRPSRFRRRQPRASRS